MCINTVSGNSYLVTAGSERAVYNINKNWISFFSIFASPNMFRPLVKPSIWTLDCVTDEIVTTSPSFMAVFLVLHVYLTKSKLKSGPGEWRAEGLDTSSTLSFSLSSDSLAVDTSSVPDISVGVVPLDIRTEQTNEQIKFKRSRLQCSSRVLADGKDASAGWTEQEKHISFNTKKKVNLTGQLESEVWLIAEWLMGHHISLHTPCFQQESAKPLFSLSPQTRPLTPLTTQLDQVRISPYNNNTISSRWENTNTIRGLLIEPIPNFLNQQNTWQTGKELPMSS